MKISILLSNSYDANDVYTSRFGQDKSEPVLDPFNLQFLMENRIVQMQLPPYSRNTALGDFFLNWRFIARVKFENMENIKRNPMLQLHTILKKVVLIIRRLKKINKFNTKESISKKINILLINYFCLFKYCLSFSAFWTLCKWTVNFKKLCNWINSSIWGKYWLGTST